MTDWFNPYRWLALAGLVAGLYFGYEAWASHQQKIGYDRAVAEFKTKAEQADAKREVVTVTVERQVQKVVHEVAVITETITKEVPVYVPSDAPALPGGFRVLHDAAARGEVPDPAGIPDAAPVSAQVVAATVAENYGACLADQKRLIAFQTWARAQASGP
jgi:hypothetical protein